MKQLKKIKDAGKKLIVHEKKLFAEGYYRKKYVNGLWAQKLIGPSHRHIWKAFAKECGAEYEEFGFPPEAVVRYHHGAIIIVMRIETVSVNMGSITGAGTVIAASLPNPGDLQFELATQFMGKAWKTVCNHPGIRKKIVESSEIKTAIGNKSGFLFKLTDTGELRFEKKESILSYLSLDDLHSWFRVFLLILDIIESTDTSDLQRTVAVTTEESGGSAVPVPGKLLGGFGKKILRISKDVLRPSHNHKWLRFAREFGAEYREVERKAVVSHHHSGAKIILREEAKTHNKESYSVISSHVPNLCNVRFHLTPRGIVSGVVQHWHKKRKGLEISQTGNARFDSDYILLTNKPALARQIFTEKSVFALLKNAPKAFVLELDYTNALRFEKREIIHGTRELERWFTLFTLLIDAFHSLDKTEAEVPLSEADAGQLTASPGNGHSGVGQSVENLIAGLGDNNYPVRRETIRALGQMGDSRATAPLIHALNDGQVLIREEAARALGLIGDKHAVGALVSALGDELSVCREAAHALGRIGGGRRVVLPLAEAENLMRVSQSVKLLRSGKALHMETRLALCNALKSIISANHETMKEYPRLFCSECLRRAVKIPISKGLFKGVALTVCPKCDDTDHLLTGAERIVGVIGGPGEDLVEDGGTVYVRLWFDQEKRIRYADLDRLLIRAGGVTHYEQAINALILELTGDATRPVSSTNKIPVRLEGNPPLSEGTLEMLKANFDFQGL